MNDESDKRGEVKIQFPNVNVKKLPSMMSFSTLDLSPVTKIQRSSSVLMND